MRKERPIRRDSSVAYITSSHDLILLILIPIIPMKRLLIPTCFPFPLIPLILILLLTLPPPPLHPNRILALLIRLIENLIQSLQFMPIRLGKRKENNRDKHDVETEKHKISFPRDRVDHNGRELHDGVVEDPIRTGRETGGLGADSNRSDFGGVEPLRGLGEKLLDSLCCRYVLNVWYVWI